MHISHAVYPLICRWTLGLCPLLVIMNNTAITWRIIADCGFTSPTEIWKHVAREGMHLPFLITDLYSRILCKRMIGVSPASYSTVDALRKNKVPVLFIHGQDDSFVPVSMTKENYEACAAPKEIMIVPGAIHGMSYAVAKEAYEEKERQFWVRYD